VFLFCPHPFFFLPPSIVEAAPSACFSPSFPPFPFFSLPFFSDVLTPRLQLVSRLARPCTSDQGGTHLGTPFFCPGTSFPFSFSPLPLVFLFFESSDRYAVDGGMDDDPGSLCLLFSPLLFLCTPLPPFCKVTSKVEVILPFVPPLFLSSLYCLLSVFSCRPFFEGNCIQMGCDSLRDLFLVGFFFFFPPPLFPSSSSPPPPPLC